MFLSHVCSFTLENRLEENPDSVNAGGFGSWMFPSVAMVDLSLMF